MLKDLVERERKPFHLQIIRWNRFFSLSKFLLNLLMHLYSNLGVFQGLQFFLQIAFTSQPLGLLSEYQNVKMDYLKEFVILQLL
jgi:hypothetical protein